jgi:hypothetical protein
MIWKWIDFKNNFLKNKKNIILIYFSMKSILKSHRNHTLKYWLNCLSIVSFLDISSVFKSVVVIVIIFQSVFLLGNVLK